MTPTQKIKAKLASLSAMERAASEGPWGIDAGLNYTQTKKGTQFQHIMGQRGAAICNTSHFDPVVVGGEVYSEGRHGKMEDAQIIVEARNNLKPLLATISELVEALDEISRYPSGTHGSAHLAQAALERAEKRLK